MTRNDASGTVLTFIVGVGVGAVAALLFAPRSGEDLRGAITDGANESLEQIRSSAKQIKQRANKVVDMAKDQVQEAIEAGEAAYNQAKKSQNSHSG